MWAVGCILYELVLRRRAFADDWEVHQYTHSGKDYDVVIGPESIPDERKCEFIVKIIKELLHVDPTRRPRADALYERFISWGSDDVAKAILPADSLAVSLLPEKPIGTSPREGRRDEQHDGPTTESRRDTSIEIAPHEPEDAKDEPFPLLPYPTGIGRPSNKARQTLQTTTTVSLPGGNPSSQGLDTQAAQVASLHTIQGGQNAQHSTNPTGDDGPYIRNPEDARFDIYGAMNGTRDLASHGNQDTYAMLSVQHARPNEPASDQENGVQVDRISTLPTVMNQDTQPRRSGVARGLVAIQRRFVGKKALIHAARDGDIERVKKLLGLNISTKITDGGGMTALHWAAYNGHRDVVALLLSHMDLGQIAARDWSRRTALHLAAWNGHGDVVALLENWEREHGGKRKLGGPTSI